MGLLLLNHVESNKYVCLKLYVNMAEAKESIDPG